VRHFDPLAAILRLNALLAHGAMINLVMFLINYMHFLILFYFYVFVSCKARLAQLAGQPRQTNLHFIIIIYY
jgi:hypothetical protein